MSKGTKKARREPGRCEPGRFMVNLTPKGLRAAKAISLQERLDYALRVGTDNRRKLNALLAAAKQALSSLTLAHDEYSFGCSSEIGQLEAAIFQAEGKAGTEGVGYCTIHNLLDAQLLLPRRRSSNFPD
jgi:hypothetical protein